MPGTLYIVATPIGNLEDITLRALRILREVDLVACEDTRQTAKLLSHYQIDKPVTSYHEHNEAEKAPALLEKLLAGQNLALASDAGTPCISDPGYRIVSAALQHQIAVIPVPGPCSFIAALSASGRPTDAFTYLGFLPSQKNARQKLLTSVGGEPRTLIFFESPHRLLDSLQEIQAILGDRQITVARELTKIYEEIFSGSISEAFAYFSGKPVRGEIVLILEKAEKKPVLLHSLDKLELKEKVEELIRAHGVPRMEALKILAHDLQIPKRELYAYLHEE